MHTTYTLPLTILSVLVSAVLFDTVYVHQVFAQTRMSPGGVACAMDAKQCPDGSWVGRNGPNCEFICPAPAVCVAPVRALMVGSSGSDVSALQQFLRMKGYFFASATGWFGPLTQHAVAQFQSDSGISAVGIVGPITRAKIRELCGNPISSVRIYSMAPSSGPVGMQVTIDGFGFTDDNTIHFGSGAIVHAPVSGQIAIACTSDPACAGGIHQTLEFTVPDALNPPCYYSNPRCLIAARQTSPGDYEVYVSNSNGTSNSKTFTVSGPGGGGVSINGLDAPASLTIGQPGTWTVHATTPSDSSTNLHYSVKWGDEINPPYMMIMAPGMTDVQSSASFTHTYQYSGTYTAIFTVTDDSGHSATVSSTIQIAPIY